MRRINCRPFTVAALLMMVVVASAQTREEEELSIRGFAGEANVVRLQGRVFVDLEDLARITNSSVSFERGRMILALAHGDAAVAAAGDTSQSGFSRAFTRAAIEAMASIRAWGGLLQAIVENGFPLGKSSSGNTITVYQDRAAASVSLAAAAASTDSDYKGLELLRNEFNSAQAWSDSYVQARTSMSAADMTMSEHPVDNDQEAQKIITCGQFLAQMFASGTFQDNAACH
ncbi:MAG TPA: hypothetical protein VMT53_04210 [Terriglobales bacterium]|nr:hypothetical protein [Terriglobales bacterium]